MEIQVGSEVWRMNKGSFTCTDQEKGESGEREREDR